MYPYIAYRDGRYQLHCGVCNHGNARLVTVFTDILGRKMVQLVCSYCRNSRGLPTPITGLADIETIAKRDSNGNVEVFNRMMHDITADVQKQYERL